MLVYMKSSLTGDESADVREYSLRAVALIASMAANV